jgi:GNAT superfamily N-acetyltransferase
MSAKKEANDNKLQFRIAKSADIDALADLRYRLCTDNAPANSVQDNEDFISAFRAVLPDIADQSSLVHFVAESEYRIVATLSIVKVNKLPHPRDMRGQWGYLTNVYTLPDYRNQGIGSRLLAVAKNWAEFEQLELLIVWPSDRSFPFYERAGFQREAGPLVLKISSGNW